MSDHRDFRKSESIEDRRRQIYRPEPGVFGDGSVPNVFEQGHGTMVALGKDDFHKGSANTPLARSLGANDIEGAAGRIRRDAIAKDIAENGAWSTFDATANDDPNAPPKRLKREPMPSSGATPLMSPQSPADPVKAAIVRAAQEDGIDPAYALAVAERESSFNPRAHSSKTIHGIYQMRGDLRAKYGVGDSSDPYAQAKGWMRSVPDLKRDMSGVLGRDATDQESYLGHHFGARRAARMLKMDPSTPVESVFTPQEMGLNPHFARAGTVGNLNSSVMGDIGKRMARFGGSMPPSPEPADLSSFGESVDAASSSPSDLSGFGTPIGTDNGPATPPATAAATSVPDLSSYGTLAAA